MAAEGAFEKVQFCAQEGDFAVEVIVGEGACDDRFMRQCIASVCVFDDEGLDAVTETIKGEAEADEPLSWGVGGQHFGFANNVVLVA